MNFNYTCLLLLFFPVTVFSQDTILVHGFLKDAISKEPIENAIIYIDSTNLYTETNAKGYYKLVLPSNSKGVSITASRVDYQIKSKKIPEYLNKHINLFLSPLIANLKIIVTESKLEQTGIKRENIQELNRLPNPSNNIESLLSGIALGVNTGSGGELSAQYNVRGGNYDENLVYVNGFEIYRPQLIRTSVREGLTFPNPDLIQRLTFSSGGFQAKYGDKLSSVLDIKYKRPESFAASLGLSLLGGTFHLEGKKLIGEKKKPFRYLLGIRMKNTEQLLNSFDTKDAATANFGDIQGYFTYQFTPSIELAYLSNFNTNQYIFRPKQSTTIASASREAFQLNSTFRGEETTDYKYTMNGVSLNYLPLNTKNPTYFNLSASFYDNHENEDSDILTLYKLYAIDSRTNSETYGAIIDTLATGGQYDFVQNQLNIKINKLQHRGGIEFDASSSNSFFLQWGLNYQKEIIEDEISEVERRGVEDYTEEVNSESIPITEEITSSLRLSSTRFSGFLQNSFTSKKGRNAEETKLTTGIRATYWDFNQAFFVSPRIQFFHRPTKRLSYHIATGLYFQSPFYRELRLKEGDLNKGIQPQKSWQIIAGLKHDFNAKKLNNQPFQLVVEAYYKQLWDLVTYDFNDVRIQYAGENNAKGYAYGLDLRLNGNFVPNSESWINLSILRTREAINGIQHKKTASNNPAGENIDNVPRPADRFMNLSIFFQDHFPSFKRLETYINYNIGTGLPYNLENEIVFRNNARYRANHQLNIGFSFSLWKEAYRKANSRHWLGFSKEAWISFDLINALNIRTVASNTVIPTANGQFLIPNFLTSRTMNVRFRMEF